MHDINQELRHWKYRFRSTGMAISLSRSNCSGTEAGSRLLLLSPPLPPPPPAVEEEEALHVDQATVCAEPHATRFTILFCWKTKR